jgi:glycosyltransferase involved in cell wall biosynthesis
LNLYGAIRDAGEFEPVLLGRAGAPSPVVQEQPLHRYSPITSINDDPNQYLIYTDLEKFDYLLQRSTDKETATKHYSDFLSALEPDVVHFQHNYLIGYDWLRVTRNTLPDAPILYTLHEYMPICHRDGQMIRTNGNRLCRKASPRRCNECFPDIPPAKLFLRERFIKAQFSLVDQFIAPSETLRDRYIDWGLPEEKVLLEDYGHLPATPIPDSEYQGSRNRFAFFGQFTPFKGTDVLLEAMAALDDDFEGHLWMHGANLSIQPRDFQERIGEMLEDAGESVTVAGSYNRAQLPRLMARTDWVIVPSIWWENSPLVIQEAFQHGRPVICSDIGGMAEKVRDGVNGLHFRRGDARHLAETISRAAETQGLWEQLQAGIPPVHSMDDHVMRLQDLYRELMPVHA